MNALAASQDREPRHPPVPTRLAHAPVSNGMVVPFITLAHRDRTHTVWGALDPVRHLDIFTHRLCQICGESLAVNGEPFGDRVVLYLRPSDHLRGIAVEPGVHPECGLYARRACPMLDGRSNRYNPIPARQRLTRCEDPACTCSLWPTTPSVTNAPEREGSPAEAWYEAWLDLSDYVVIPVISADNDIRTLGVDIRNATLLKVRKIRAAAPSDDGDQPMDLLAALVAARELFGNASDPA
ncbi:hypothetical protein [Nocardia sp. NPDC052566]|uniref:hypothetical protein n=1 Tax=Nocardia sp. NPDC052566 TaxID=3364330 RepID=UPI0037C97927